MSSSCRKVSNADAFTMSTGEYSTTWEAWLHRLYPAKMVFSLNGTWYLATLKVYKNPGPNRSGISDRKYRGPKKGPKTARIWVVEIRNFQFLSNLSVQIKYTLKLRKNIVLLFLNLYIDWYTRHRIRVRAIFIFSRLDGAKWTVEHNVEEYIRISSVEVE